MLRRSRENAAPLFRESQIGGQLASGLCEIFIRVRTHEKGGTTRAAACDNKGTTSSTPNAKVRIVHKSLTEGSEEGEEKRSPDKRPSVAKTHVCQWSARFFLTLAVFLIGPCITCALGPLTQVQLCPGPGPIGNVSLVSRKRLPDALAARDFHTFLTTTPSCHLELVIRSRYISSDLGSATTFLV